MKLFYLYVAIFFNFPPTLTHLHPLQVENCDSNSRLVVDEVDKFRLERVNTTLIRTSHSIIPSVITMITKYEFCDWLYI